MPINRSVRKVHASTTNRLALIALVAVGPMAQAGSIFITGHDPVWHASFGGNAAGAKNLAETAIDYARNGSSLPFLFIESKTAAIPGGNAQEAPFLTSSLKYTGPEVVVMDAADLGGLADFRTALDSYSAVVVASDHGGMLTSAELGFLDLHAADIIDYLNGGGGLAAFAESDAAGNIGATQRFGFLPFLAVSSDFQASEVANVVTAAGAGLGLSDSDVNGNFSHNYFSATGGMTPIDLFNGDPGMPLSLAFRGGSISTGGVPDAGPTSLLFGLGLSALGWLRRRPSAE